MNPEAKFKLILSILLITILIILIVRAYRKETIEKEVEAPAPRYKKKSGNRRGRSSNPKRSREEKCREILQSIYHDQFPSVRPSFLKNPKTGRNLELDGYNDRLKVAFEYNGRQHYEFPNTFHKTKEDFDKQVKRDIFKERKCKEHGINLISIPYYIEDDQLYDFIRRKTKRKR